MDGWMDSSSRTLQQALNLQMEGFPVQPVLEYAPKVCSNVSTWLRISCSMEPSVVSMV